MGYMRRGGVMKRRGVKEAVCYENRRTDVREADYCVYDCSHYF